MSRIKQLAESYAKHISVPWRNDAAAAQRVIFCIYKEDDELKLRAGIGEFELATNRAKRGWVVYDLTNTFAEWLLAQKYSVSYFKKPDLLTTLLPKYLDFLSTEFGEFLVQRDVDANTVVAITGAGSLFGLLKVKNVVERFAVMVPGRLLVFFPGSYENNNYRLLDGYDGWNYLAVPLTADREV